MTAIRTPAYPTCCPQCLRLAAFPFAAATCERENVIVVKLRCRQCGGEWSEDAPKTATAPVLTRPKPDRRAAWRRTA
ncbi:MAG TPA: hypothetical protein VEC39_15180 [Vicinamibacterales bacterium]|nr:hypothetical protein [Vicinamibacterales bacterium]